MRNCYQNLETIIVNLWKMNQNSLFFINLFIYSFSNGIYSHPNITCIFLPAYPSHISLLHVPLPFSFYMGLGGGTCVSPYPGTSSCYRTKPTLFQWVQRRQHSRRNRIDPLPKTTELLLNCDIRFTGLWSTLITRKDNLLLSNGIPIYLCMGQDRSTVYNHFVLLVFLLTILVPLNVTVLLTLYEENIPNFYIFSTNVILIPVFSCHSNFLPFCFSPPCIFVVLKYILQEYPIFENTDFGAMRWFYWTEISQVSFSMMTKVPMYVLYKSVWKPLVMYDGLNSNLRSQQSV